MPLAEMRRRIASSDAAMRKEAAQESLPPETANLDAVHATVRSQELASTMGSHDLQAATESLQLAPTLAGEGMGGETPLTVEQGQVKSRACEHARNCVFVVVQARTHGHVYVW